MIGDLVTEIIKGGRGERDKNAVTAVRKGAQASYTVIL